MEAAKTQFFYFNNAIEFSRQKLFYVQDVRYAVDAGMHRNGRAARGEATVLTELEFSLP